MHKQQFLSWTVFKEHFNESLQKFLHAQLAAKSSIKSIKKAIEKGLCQVNGHIELFGSKKLSVNDVVQLDDQWQEHIKAIAATRIKILFEDAHYIVIDKPINVSCDASLYAYFSQKIYLVHRLDKMTSGTLIVAKSRSAQKKMEDLFRQKKVHKKYLALVDGTVNEKKIICERPLIKKCSFQGQTLYQTTSSKNGRIATTIFTRIDSKKNISLLLCQPITGRTHQIRVHLHYLGYPILGDYLYSRHFDYPYYAPRLMLHSYEVAFFHPFMQKIVTIKAPIPTIFTKILPIPKMKEGRWNGS